MIIVALGFLRQGQSTSSGNANGSNVAGSTNPSNSINRRRMSHDHQHEQTQNIHIIDNSEGSAVDDLSFISKPDKQNQQENQDLTKSQKETEEVTFIKTDMSTPEDNSKTEERGGQGDRRGSDDNYERVTSPNDGRGSEDSLTPEGISMEKQDIEKKEKTNEEGDEKEEGGASEVGVQSTDASQMKVISPVMLEVGQVVFAPSSPPMSTSMPVTRKMSPNNEDLEQADRDEEVLELTYEQKDADEELPEDKKEVVEDVHEKGHYTLSAMNGGEDQHDKDGSEQIGEANERPQNDDDDDDDDEHIGSVSENGDEEATQSRKLSEDIEEDGEGTDVNSDQTFPLRTYNYASFYHSNNFSHYEKLAGRSRGDTEELLSGYHDDASSVVSDVFSPRIESLRTTSLNRFKSQMPKFSTKAYSFKHQHPVPVSTPTPTPRESYNVSRYFLDDNVEPLTEEVKVSVF